jgi:hypothetical protein
MNPMTDDPRPFDEHAFGSRDAYEPLATGALRVLDGIVIEIGAVA